MIWFVLLLVTVLGVVPAYGERWLVPVTPPGGTVPQPIAIGTPDDTPDYYRIDTGCALTLEGPGVMRFTICGPADLEATSPETLRITIDGLAEFGTQRWTEAVLTSKNFGFGADPAARVTQPRTLTLAIPGGAHDLSILGNSSWGGPVYAHFVYEGPPSVEAEAARESESFAPDRAHPAWPGEPVPIGLEGEFRDYYRIDQGCPVHVEGPGVLRLFARAHVQPGRPEPQQLDVTITGLPGLGVQRWVDRLRPASTYRFGDGRPGFPTDARKILLSIPAGAHDLIVTGATDGGDPVFATFSRQLPPPPVVEAAPAAEKAPRALRKPRSPWRVTGDLTLDTIYDDNIGRFSESTLAELRSGTNPEGFGIETEDDLIVHSILQSELSHASLLLGKGTRLRLRYQRWEYMRNALKTNDEVNVRVRQYVRGGDYVEAAYTYAPDGYVKELNDRPPYTSIVVPRYYEHFVVTRNDFDLAYRYGIDSWLAVRLSGGRTLRFYNQRFMENDVWEWSWGVAPDITLGRLGLRPEYQYVSAKARGYDQVDETLENSDNDGDGSSEKDTYRLRVSYSPGDEPYTPGSSGTGALASILATLRAAGALVDRGLIAARTASFDVQLSYGRQFYTSKKPLDVDPGHVGRLDQSKQIQLGWSSTPVYRRASLEAGVRYTVRTAKAPAGLIGEDDPSEEKDFTGTRYWLSVVLPLR
jgi:hypothetical protein